MALKTTSVSVSQLLNASAESEEKNWLKHASQLLDKTNIETGHTVSWSAYHASMLSASPETNTAALTQLLPLFYHKVATAAMIKHGIDVLRQATEFLLWHLTHPSLP